MRKYLLNNKALSAEFCLNDGGMTMTVNHGKEYIFTFADEFTNGRITFDNYANLPFDLVNIYLEETTVNANENTVEFITCPECAKPLRVINRFSLLEAAVVQETFFEIEGVYYDCSYYMKAHINGEIFKTLGSDREGYALEIKDMERSKPANKGELVLKGDGSYLKVYGGMVTFSGATLEPHGHAYNYVDTLSYYNEENSLFTVYCFEDCEKPERKTVRKPDNKPEIFTLESGKLCAKYVIKKDGFAQYHKMSEYPVAALQLRKIDTKEKLFFDTLSGWGSVKVNKSANTTEFVLSAPNGLEGITLKLTANAIPEISRLEWDVCLINESEEYSLMWCTYPRFYYDSEKSTHLFMPEACGTEFTNFSDTDNFYNGSYPGGFLGTMAYMALYTDDKDSGVYYAVHDNKGSKKEFQAASTQTGSTRLTCRYFAERYGKPGNTNHLPGKAVWQAFSGDWFDATEIYREFVKKECFWAQKTIDEKTTPDWMKELPFWVMDWVPQDSTDGEPIPTNLRTDTDVILETDWYENVIKLQKELGTPVGYHVYNWHKIPFNNDYPHFLPAKESFKKGMEELKKHNIRVMPYINALLWDNKDRGNENFEFEEFGKPGAIKKEDGSQVIMTYESRESDGELVKLSAMCPSYPLWRKKLAKLTSDMFNELDVDAIYLDQIAARMPHLCMDETHNHEVGGGSWWVKEYNDLIKEVYKSMPEGKAFTTECNAEVYGEDMDGFLSWAWIRSISDVPAFMRIYSDNTLMLGRNTNGYMKLSDMHWKYHFAQSLVFAQQMGWINADVVKMPERLEFIKKLIRFRYENKEFFHQVTVLRPPKVLTERSHMFASYMGMSQVGILIKPYISCGALKNGKTHMIVLVNIANEEMTDIINFNPNEYNPGSNFEVYGCGKIKVLKPGEMECTIEKENYLCIKWEEN